MLGALILGLLMQDPALPQWARDDPFAWERARCHPQIRGETPLESCQFRVRQQLMAELGDGLPAALRPTTALKPAPALRLMPTSPFSATSRAKSVAVDAATARTGPVQHPPPRSPRRRRGLGRGLRQHARRR